MKKLIFLAISAFMIISYPAGILADEIPDLTYDESASDIIGGGGAAEGEQPAVEGVDNLETLTENEQPTEEVTEETTMAEDNLGKNLIEANEAVTEAIEITTEANETVTEQSTQSQSTGNAETDNVVNSVSDANDLLSVVITNTSGSAEVYEQVNGNYAIALYSLPEIGILNECKDTGYVFFAADNIEAENPLEQLVLTSKAPVKEEGYGCYMTGVTKEIDYTVDGTKYSKTAAEYTTPGGDEAVHIFGIKISNFPVNKILYFAEAYRMDDNGISWRYGDIKSVSIFGESL